MPPGNICCNSKESGENVSSFTLPDNPNKQANGHQDVKESPVISPNAPASKESSSATSVTLPPAKTAASLAVPDRPIESSTLPDIHTRTETSFAIPERPIEPSVSLDSELKTEPSVKFSHTIIESTEEISDSEINEDFNKMPLQLTKPAPQFKTTAVVNGEFKDISLADYKGKYVVLFFYPLDFTFVCPTEIIAFSERADDFRKIGCEVIAASTDSHFTHLAWINTPRKQGGLGPMNIPILSDKSHRIARDYGVLDEETGIPFRGLFIIDDSQRLRQITVNDLPVGRSVEETLRLVQAFQYTDKYGEVCPANWTPGSKTIKPDTKAAKEYFGDAN